MTSVDFAAAQQRIAHRRAERAEFIRAQEQRRQQELDSSALSRLPAPLRAVCVGAWSQWQGIRGREGTNPAFRVGQVDAELLDETLLDLLKGQVGDALKYFGPHLRDDWSAEIQLLLRAVLFKLTVWDHDASYGAALQNLRYTDSRGGSTAHVPPRRWQKALHGLVSVGGRYAWTKWEDHLLDLEGGYDEPSPRIRLLSRLSTLASSAHSLAAFASFLVFLVNGRYRTILDRVLRLRLTPTTSQVRREVSFEYLNRQLVWHAFTEFLLFLLPLVGISRWRRWLARAWRKTKSLFLSRGGSTTSDDDAAALKAHGELGFLPERTCAICDQDQNPTSAADNEMAAIAGASSGVVGSSQTDVTNPYETIPCGCVYCFVCLAQRLEAEDGEGWPCLRCGELATACRPWEGDVLEELRRSGSRKRVSFAAAGGGASSGLHLTDEDATLDRAAEDGDSTVVDGDAFTALDPIPIDDEKSVAVSNEIAPDGEISRRRRSLDESAEWSRPDAALRPDADDDDDDDGESTDLEAEAQLASLAISGGSDDEYEDEEGDGALTEKANGQGG